MYSSVAPAANTGLKHPEPDTVTPGRRAAGEPKAPLSDHDSLQGLLLPRQHGMRHQSKSGCRLYLDLKGEGEYR